MNGQFLEIGESDYENELLAFDREEEGGDFEAGFDSRQFAGSDRESDEIELAAELLSVSDEQTLDEFFGAFLRGARGLLRSPAGQKLKDLLRNTARNALPLAGQALGGFFENGNAQAAAAQDAGDAGSESDADAGELFGIETEGLSPEDRDLEVARRVVRLAGDAARRLSNAPSGDPMRAARRAIIGAAQRHAPGLASRLRNAGPARNRSITATGRWIRHGSTIVILDV